MHVEKLIGKTVLVVIIWSACAVPSMARRVSSQDIQLAVEKRLMHDVAVSDHLVDVEVHDGIVTLAGSVDNLLTKERSPKVARTVKGVRSVVNRLVIRPELRSDEAIEKDIAWEMFYDPVTDSHEVQVMVDDGRATLVGTVDSWQERKQSAMAAKQVSGLKAVDNRIKVDYKMRRSDLEIATDIRSRLLWDVWIDPSGVEIEASGGKVSLTGEVGSNDEKARAHHIAWVTGVKSVDSERLEVNCRLNNRMRRKKEHHVNKKDVEIKKAVKAAFLYDPRVFFFNPEIRVNAGVVTLFGVVDSLAAKQAAEQDANNTVGVWRVRNQLKVRRLNQVSDEKIMEIVYKALSDDPYLDRRKINVGVRNAKVYLQGEVGSRLERIRAGVLASKARGVMDVDNLLRVKYLDSWRRLKTDLIILQDINDELWWSPFVDADQVHVRVRDGVATLTGTVDTYLERGAAVDNAYEGGARDVKNHLKVETYHTK
jgi:osmotically-inducible protein OsmY